MKRSVDLAIIGSGFGGTLLALIARRLGLSVILLERQRHPRFAMGESSTPLANLFLEDLAHRYDLPELLPFTKWGPWQRQRPEVRCGLKRGFTFYHHRPNEPWERCPQRSNELLVAASPRDEIADTHWYRADFDHALLKLAQARGAEVLEEFGLETATMSPEGACLTGRTGHQALTIQTRFVVDASGPRGFLARALALPESGFPSLPSTQALYSHFENVERWADLFPSSDLPPYPPDDAAVHHVFPGGWIWVLRFNHGIVSAGVAATSSFAEELQLSDGLPAWSRLLDGFPSIRQQFANARACLEFRHHAKLSYRAGVAVGDNWALLPSAAGFVDPLLSTGFPLTLIGIERLARLLEEDWRSNRWSARLKAYEHSTLIELDRAANLVGALYDHFADFTRFSNLALLYFAAASFAETSRRLGRNQTNRSFLDLLETIPAIQDCLAKAHSKKSSADLRMIREAIEPINIAGLADPARHQWYPARIEDLLAGADKLGATTSEIEAMLRRVGFIP